MTRYDLLVIGAGPSSVGALLALPEDISLCVVTGEHESHRRLTGLHPKIRSTAYERRERPKIYKMRVKRGGATGALYAASGVGGLARYWGQQFVRYAPNDPWPQVVFGTYQDYCVACDAVEASFTLSPRAPDPEYTSPYVSRTPRLMVGANGGSRDGLLSMTHACEQLLARRCSAVARDRVESIASHQGGIRVQLSSGRELQAGRVILAAGVVGTWDILARSSADIDGAVVADHCPFLMYVSGARRLGLGCRSDGIDHFNTRTIERVEGDRVIFFGSLYRMSRAPLSLTLAGVGLPPMFRGLRTPAIADLISPVQVWTEKTVSKYLISKRGQRIECESPQFWQDDPECVAFRNWVLDRGASILKVSRSRPGEGFHYHSMTLALSGGQIQMDLSQYLHEMYGGKVVCVDASVLNRIGCRPSGLTIMATAYASAKQICENS